MTQRADDRPWWASEQGGEPRAAPGPWHDAPGAAADDVPPWDPPRDPPPAGGDGRPADDAGRDWIGDAASVLGGVAREAARRAQDLSGAGDRDDAAPTHRIDTCGICPFCTLLRVVAEARPEVVQHVAEATRHLTLALRAVVDAQAAQYGDRGFEHIEVGD